MAFVTQKEFARKIRKTPQYVNKLVRQHKLALDPRTGKLDLKKALHAYQELKALGQAVRGGKAAPRRRSGAKPEGRPAQVRSAQVNGHAGGHGVAFGRPSDTKTLTGWRTRTEEFKAKQAELDYQLAAGNLLRKEDVLRAEQRKNLQIRTQLLRLPRIEAPGIAGSAAPAEIARVETRLMAAVERVLQTLVLDPLGMEAASAVVQTSAVEAASGVPA